MSSIHKSELLMKSSQNKNEKCVVYFTCFECQVFFTFGY